MLDYDLLQILFNLPKGRTLNVPIQNEMRTSDIPNQIKRMLNHTGLDMMCSLRESDIKEWIEVYSKNFDMKISYNSFDRILQFHKKEDLSEKIYINCIN